MPSSAAIEKIEDARQSLLARLVGQIDRNGAVEDRGGSRILESALFLILLRNRRKEQHLQDSLTRYLCGAQPAHPIESLVVEAVLEAGRMPPRGDAAQRFLAAFSHFTGDRKRMLLATLLAVTGVVSAESARAEFPGGKVAYEGFAVWTSLSLCAMNVLYSSDDQDTNTELKYLIDQLGRFSDGVWEGNLLAHLLALHALQTRVPEHRLIDSGIAALAATQNPDGGVPFVSGQEIFITALAGVALHAAGSTPQALRPLGDYLARHQQGDGGWGYTRFTTQTDVDDTARCVEFLRLLDPDGYRRVLADAEAYLIGMAGADGGFPTYVRSHPSDIDMTAGALIALAPTAPPQIIQDGAGFLINSQHGDGTFTPGWTLSESSVMLRVVHGLTAIVETGHYPVTGIAHVVKRCRDRLRDTQNPDGGWGHTSGRTSDVLSTAQAVPVLCSGSPPGPEVGWALTYLLHARQPNNGFISIPDQVGPRPVPFDFPALVDIHTLAALSQCASVVAAERCRT